MEPRLINFKDQLSRLAVHGISANGVAAYYHDRIFVPAAKAQEALHWLTVIENGDAI